MFTVESGIKIPPKTVSRSKYPWAHMKPGDSFLVREIDHRKASNVKASGKRWLKANAKEYLSVVYAPDGDGYRFWFKPGGEPNVLDPKDVSVSQADGDPF